MDAKTLKALKGSIGKWEGVVAGTEREHASWNCPLCQISKGSCDACPVKIKTKCDSCEDSPFIDWDVHQRIKHDKWMGSFRKVLCPTCLRLARAELRFLKSLLPKGER